MADGDRRDAGQDGEGALVPAKPPTLAPVPSRRRWVRDKTAGWGQHLATLGAGIAAATTGGVEIVVWTCGFAALYLLGVRADGARKAEERSEVEKAEAAARFEIEKAAAEARHEVEAMRETVSHYAHDIFDAVTMKLALRCKVPKVDPATYRVSVYVPFGEDQFVLLGRHSFNSDYCVASDRPYLVGEGLVGQAWKRGEISVGDGPDPRNVVEYTAWQVRNHLHQDTVKLLKMQSRGYYMRRIDNSGEPLAVIVFESTVVDDWQQLEIRFKSRLGFDEEHGEAHHLRDLILRTRNYLANDTMAKDFGYG